MTGRGDIDDSSNDDRRSQPEITTIINCVLNAPLMLISIIGNTLVIAAILRTPSLLSPSTILLCSLAVSDIFVGLVAQPVSIAYQLSDKDSLHQAIRTVSFLALGGSLATMTAISVDQFAALHYHMRYPNLMTAHRALYISAALWLSIFLSSWLHFWNINAHYSVTASSIALCLFLSTCCYIGIYRIVRHHQLQIHNHQQAMEANADDSSLVWSFYSALLRSPCVPCAFPLLICITVKSMTSPIVIT